jgi:hypothetical protein
VERQEHKEVHLQTFWVEVGAEEVIAVLPSASTAAARPARCPLPCPFCCSPPLENGRWSGLLSPAHVDEAADVCPARSTRLPMRTTQQREVRGRTCGRVLQIGRHQAEHRWSARAAMPPGRGPPPAGLPSRLAACWFPAGPPGTSPPSMAMPSSDNHWRRLGFRGGDREQEWARRGGVEEKKP